MNTKVNVVTNFLEYYKAISDYKMDAFFNVPSNVPVFRGVIEDSACGKYLIPSVDVQHLVKYEYELISEMARHNPLEYNQVHGIHLLEKMQHFGLPTRLLDFSLSPYIALYFAVRNNSEAIHKVYCYAATFNDVIAETIANIPLRMRYHMYDVDRDRPMHIDKILYNSEQTSNAYLKDFLITVDGANVANKVIFTHPSFYTQREQNQQSVFAIFCNQIEDRESVLQFGCKNFASKVNALDISVLRSRLSFVPQLYNPFLNEKDNKYLKEIIIDNASVDSIRYELNDFGINEAFLFPENLENIANEIREKIYAKYIK